MNRAPAALLLLVFATSTGCVRREGRNSDCRWPEERDARALDPSRQGDAWHLREDVELAEELAVRYMDTHRQAQPGQIPPERPSAVMNACRDSLLHEVSALHNVSPKELLPFFGRRSTLVDFAVILPYLLLYGILAMLLARWLLRRYPPDDGMSAALAMLAFGSVVFAVAGLLLGEEWSLAAESLRIGTGHLSYRVDRVPWGQHRAAFFALCFALFWIAAAVRLRARQRA